MKGAAENQEITGNTSKKKSNKVGQETKKKLNRSASNGRKRCPSGTPMYQPRTFSRKIKISSSIFGSGLSLWCRYAGNTGIIAATGTTTHAATNGCPRLTQRLHRHYSGQPTLLNRHYRGTTTVTGTKAGNRHYSINCRYSLFPSVPSDFTGTIAGNRHCSTGTIEGPLLCCVRLFVAYRYLEEDGCGFGVVSSVDLVEHRHHRVVQHLSPPDLDARLNTQIISCHVIS